jgi:hypothetical protein
MRSSRRHATANTEPDSWLPTPDQRKCRWGRMPKARRLLNEASDVLNEASDMLSEHQKG